MPAQVVKVKTCYRCGGTEPECTFSERYGTHGGHANWCSSCRNAYNRKVYHERGGKRFNRVWRAKNPDKIKQYAANSWKKHRERRLKELRERRQHDPEYAAHITDLAKKYRIKLKREVVEAYGGQCACCGEKQLEFLTVEHTNHDGKVHRQKVGELVYNDLKNRGFPKDGIAILCWNCNMATRFGSICPHKRQALKSC